MIILVLFFAVYAYNQKINPTGKASSGEEITYSGLVAHWKFQNNLQDSVGSNHGKYIIPLNTPPVFDVGIVNYAISLSNKDKHAIRVGTSQALQPTKGTIMTWIKPKSVPTYGEVVNGVATYDMATIFTTNWGSKYQTPALKLRNKNLVLQLSNNKISKTYVLSSKEIPLNEWSHVAATWDSSIFGGTVKLYLNGKLLNTYSQGITPVGNNAMKLIGGNASAYPRSAFDGLIDELKIYNIVKTPTEISQIYNTERVDGINSANNILLRLNNPYYFKATSSYTYRLKDVKYKITLINELGTDPNLPFSRTIRVECAISPCGYVDKTFNKLYQAQSFDMGNDKDIDVIFTLTGLGSVKGNVNADDCDENPSNVDQNGNKVDPTCEGSVSKSPVSLTPCIGYTTDIYGKKCLGEAQGTEFYLPDCKVCQYNCNADHSKCEANIQPKCKNKPGCCSFQNDSGMLHGAPYDPVTEKCCDSLSFSEMRIINSIPYNVEKDLCCSWKNIDGNIDSVVHKDVNKDTSNIATCCGTDLMYRKESLVLQDCKTSSCITDICCINAKTREFNVYPYKPWPAENYYRWGGVLDSCCGSEYIKDNKFCCDEDKDLLCDTMTEECVYNKDVYDSPGTCVPKGKG
ncbi:MAG: LamG domain-containing protein [Nanoarchaeota archaeon]